MTPISDIPLQTAKNAGLPQTADQRDRHWSAAQKADTIKRDAVVETRTMGPTIKALGFQGRRTAAMKKLLLAVVVAGAVAISAYWALSVQRPEGSLPNGPGGSDLASVLANISEEGFERPPPDWQLDLPQDHGAHDSSRTETWQLVTHLRDEDGGELGFQYLFLRMGIVAPTTSPKESIWDVRELERVHVALLDANSGKVTHEERFGRGMTGLSGFDRVTRELRLDNWFLRFADEGGETVLTLFATIGDKAVVELVMRPAKQSVALEPGGADAPFAGYSMTRLTVEGSVDQGRGKKAITGTAWFDHLWGELPVPGSGPVAWDRLQLQLEDGVEISAVRSRRIDGRGAAAVNGTVFGSDGEVISLNDETLQMTASRTWRHPSTGTGFPVEWRILGPEMDITIEPLFDAQWLDFSIPLWSGIVRVSGSRGQTPVSGFGTLQLTGYEQ